MSKVDTERLLEIAKEMYSLLDDTNKKLYNLESESKDQYDEYSRIMEYNGKRIGWKDKKTNSNPPEEKYECTYISIYANPANIVYYEYVHKNYGYWDAEIELLSKAISYIEDNAYTIDSLYSQLIDILDTDYNNKNDKENRDRSEIFHEILKQRRKDKENPGDDSKTIPNRDRSEIFHEILMQRRNDKKENNLQINPTEKPGNIITPTKNLEDIGNSPSYDNNRRNYENNNDGVKKVGKIAPIVNVSSEAISSIRDNTAELEKKYDSDIDNLNSDSNNDNNKVDKLAASVKDVYKVNKETNDNASNQPIENSQVLVEQQIGAAKPIVGVAQQVTNAAGSIPAKADTNTTYNPVTNDDSTMVSYNDSKPYVDGQNNNSSVISVSDNKGLNNIIPGVAAVVAGTGVGLAVKGKLDEDKDEEYEIEG